MKSIKEIEKKIEYEIERDFEEIFEDDEFMEETQHKFIARLVLLIRNISVLIAAVLFLISIFAHGDITHKLRGIAYFFGAICYFLELVEMTEYFTHRPPAREMFMIYAFGPLYVLMGISYLMH